MLSTLSTDGELIDDTRNEHKIELKKELKSAKSQLNRVRQLEFIEKYSVSIALAFFYAVVAYVIIRRTRVLLILYHVLVYIYTSYHTNNEIDQEVLIRIIETISNSTANTSISDFSLENIINSTSVCDIQPSIDGIFTTMHNESMEYN